MDNIVLKVNNKAFEGWTDIVVSRSLSNISGTFTLSVSERYPFIPENWDTRIGDPCSVEINNTTVINGYIDDINIRYSASGHTVEFLGRDKTADLIDCCYTGPNQFLNQTLKSVITKICDTFSIEVKIDSDVASVCNEKINNNSVTANIGMNIYELITELCKSKGILATSYGDGRLVLTRAGLNGKIGNDTIQTGYNILECSANFTNRERYKTYRVYAHGKGNDNKTDLESYITAKSNLFTDKIIKRTRPFVKLIDAADIDTCNKYAKWEMSYRSGKSRKIEYTLTGWTQKNGLLWEINKTIYVIDEILGIQNNLLIDSVEFSSGENTGKLTKLGVVDITTYDIIEPNASHVKVVPDPNPNETEASV